VKKAKLHKEFCEIEGCSITDPNLLEHHHIRDRVLPGSTNDPHNLSVLCCTHHKMIDSGRLRIIGVFDSTDKYGRTLVYELDGVVNFPGLTPQPFEPSVKRIKIR